MHNVKIIIFLLFFCINIFQVVWISMSLLDQKTYLVCFKNNRYKWIIVKKKKTNFTYPQSNFESLNEIKKENVFTLFLFFIWSLFKKTKIFVEFQVPQHLKLGVDPAFLAQTTQGSPKLSRKVKGSAEEASKHLMDMFGSIDINELFDNLRQSESMHDQADIIHYLYIAK